MGYYRIDVYNKRQEFSRTDYSRIYEKLRYYARQKGVDFFAVFSSTASSSATRVTLHTGERGRPRAIVQGYKIAPHIHCAVSGKKAHAVAVAVCEKLNKQASQKIARPISLGNEKHLANFYEYARRQADIFRSNNRAYFNNLRC
jgi:hypothetical protein